MITIINAPSILGLRPSGVEHLPEALHAAGLRQKLNVPSSAVFTVTPPTYSPQRDSATHMLNPEGLASYAKTLADTIERTLQDDAFPLVLGGDCSILLGNLLALKWRGRYGLFFLDGHADFYQPEASEKGEAADMDLALVSGRGPEIVTNIEGQKPLVRDEDIVQFGQRDRQETLDHGSQQIADTGIRVFELDEIRRKGLTESGRTALDYLTLQPVEGIWLHVDADVMSDDEVPAVDYRQPGGLTFAEMEILLSDIIATKKVVGMDLTVFNPSLDPDGRIGSRLVDLLAKTLQKA